MKSQLSCPFGFSSSAPPQYDWGFSLIVPAFNYAQYLPRAIESALGELRSQDEILVVDDGSTDATAEVVRGYGSSVRYFHQQNQGPYAACLNGIAQSRNDYLMILDADDELLPGALGGLRQKLQRAEPPRVVFGRYAEVSEDGRTRRVSPEPVLGDQLTNFKSFLNRRLPLVIGAAAIHRSVFDWLSQVTKAPRHGMDIVALAHILLHHRCEYIDAELLNVHAHPGRLRNNVASIAAVGDELAEVLFDPRWTTDRAQKMKGTFASWWRREEGRAFYHEGRYEEAVQAYLRAFGHSWFSSVSPTNLRRFGVALTGSLKNRVSKSRVAADDRKMWPLAKKAGSHDRDMSRQPITFLDRCFAEHGDHVRVRYVGETFFVNDLQDVNHILQINSSNYTKKNVFLSPPFDTVLGEGLLSSSGRRHRQDRLLMQPVLHRRDVRRHTPQILESCLATVDRWSHDQQVNLTEETHLCVRDAMTQIVLGKQNRSLGPELDVAISKAYERAVLNAERRWKLPAWVPTKTRQKDSLALDRLDELLLSVVHGIRQKPSDSGGLLCEFAAAAEKSGVNITDRMLRDHACNLLFASVGTLPTWITWVCHELGKRPSLQSNVRREINQVCGNDMGNFDDKTPLELLDRVINETIRLHPSPWRAVHRAIERDPLPSGIVVPAGARIQISIHHLHRNPEWFPDPERFEPNRFTPENVQKRPQIAFSPFSFGARGCVGKPLAKMAARLIVSTILQRFELESLPETSNTSISYSPISAFPTEPIRLLVRRCEGQTCPSQSERAA